jgi:hypothetical protein
MGGVVGRLIPLINDVAESALLLAQLAAVSELKGPIGRLVICALPSEISELLRLSIGPPAAAQAYARDTDSLLAHYRIATRSPDPLAVLENLEKSIPQRTRDTLQDWRNRLGAHTDEDTPWSDLEAEIESAKLGDYIELLEWIELNLEVTACRPGGPPLLLLGSRRFKTLLPTLGTRGSFRT